MKYLLIFLFFTIVGKSQVTGDYRSNGSVTLTSITNWQRYNGSSWVSATIAPNSFPFTSSNNITVRSSHTLTVSGTVSISNPSFFISGTVNIADNAVFTIGSNTSWSNFTINSGGIFQSPGGSGHSVFVHYGNYYNNGSTDFWKSDVIITGDLITPSTSELQNNGNVIVGGNIIGNFDISGSGSGQIYAVNSNATVTITPASIDGNVTPGTQPTGESTTLQNLVNQVIYGSNTCTSFTVTDLISNIATCVGSNVSVSIITSASSPTYQWQVNSGLGWSDITGQTSATLSLTSITAGMDGYKYRVKVSTTCTKNSNYVTLSVVSSVAPTGVTGITTICEGSSTTLTVSGGTPQSGATTQWFTSSCGGTSAGTGNSITVSPTVTTIYYVRYSGSCNTTVCASTIVTVKPLPNNIGTGFSSSGSFCPGGPATITFDANNLSGTPPYVLSYRNSSGTLFSANIPNDSATAFLVTPPPSVTTTYTLLSITDNNGAGCQRTTGFEDNTAIVTIATPQGSITANGPFCSTGAGQLTWTATAGTGPYTIVYNDGVANRTVSDVVSGTAFSTFITPVTSTTTYTLVSVTSTNNCVRTTGFTGASATISNDSSTTWNGTSWSNLTPTATKAAVINGNYTVSTDLAACTLTVNSGIVTVNSGVTLTITNAITVAGGQLIFNNNASLIQTTNATNTGFIQYKRTSSLMKNFDYTYWSSPVTGQTAKALSPNTLADKYFKFDGAANNWVFDDGEMIAGRGYIIRVPKPGNWPLPNAEVVTDPYFQPVTFTGVPNNGDKTFAVGANQYNLIGNPYPSALNADAFITANSGIISGALYFWTHSTPITQSGSKYVYPSNDYATYNISGGVKTFGNFNSPEWVDLNNNKTIDPGEWSDKNGNGIVDKGEWVDANNNQILETNEWNDVNNNGIAETSEWTDANNNNIFETGEWIDSNADKVLNLGVEVVTNKPSGKIAAGQSFFVGSKAAGNFNFTNAMRVADNNSQFFKFSKTATLERNRIWLNLTNTAGAFKQLLIGYLTGATNNWDSLYDGPSFDGNTFIDFYSINNTSKLTIQGRALPFEITDSVPLGYRSTIEGPFEIAIDQTDGLLSSKEILLEDKKTGTTHNLTQEKYSFTAIKGVENDRFVLKYAEKPIIKEAILVQRVAVYVKDKKITVNSTLIPIEKILVYDVSGRKIYEKESIGLNEYILENFANNKQFLIVKTILKDETVTTEKVIF